MLGLPSIDSITGGLRSRKINLFVGFSSHGKTSLMLSALVRNLDKRALFVSCDDTDDLLLGKLIAMHFGCTTTEVEAQGPAWRMAYVEEHFPNLIVATPKVGSSYTVDELWQVYMQASEDLGGPAEIACFDFLSLLAMKQGDTENGVFNVGSKVKALKDLARSTPDAVWMIGHQCNRSAGYNCKQLQLNHIEYGGHQETDGVIIGCRRRIDTEECSTRVQMEEARCPSTNISVMKNKVTGWRSPDPAGEIHAIDPISGLIRPFTDADRPEVVERPRLRFADVPYAADTA